MEYISFNAGSPELIWLLIGKSWPTLTRSSNISPLLTNIIQICKILLPLSSIILLLFLTSQCHRGTNIYQSRANCGYPPWRSNPLPSVSEAEVIVMSHQDEKPTSTPDQPYPVNLIEVYWYRTYLTILPTNPGGILTGSKPILMKKTESMNKFYWGKTKMITNQQLRSMVLSRELPAYCWNGSWGNVNLYNLV